MNFHRECDYTHQSVTTDKPMSIEDTVALLKLHLITNRSIRQLDELAERGHKVIKITPIYDPKDGNVYDFQLEFEGK